MADPQREECWSEDFEEDVEEGQAAQEGTGAAGALETQLQAS